MKKRLQKAAGLLMATVLAAGMLAGCGSKEEAAPETTQPEETGQETAGQTESGDTSPVTIKMVNKDMSADDEVSVTYVNTVAQKVSEQLGREVTIEIVPISDGTYSENMGLLLQSGEIPDLMYFQGGDYQFAITQQILEDLTPYIEGSTYVKAAMQPFNEQRLDNYPYLLWLAPDRIKVPVVRKDWFEATESGKTLLEDPSPENYKSFFQELKEKNNLKAAYTVPGDLGELDTVFNLAFGVDKTWVEQDGAYVYSKVSNAMKDKLAYYADLYKEEIGRAHV